MKHCIHCGAERKIENPFCLECGKEQAVESTEKIQTKQSMSNPPQPPAKKKKAKKWIPITIISLILVAGLVAAGMGYKNMVDKQIAAENKIELLLEEGNKHIKASRYEEAMDVIEEAILVIDEHSLKNYDTEEKNVLRAETVALLEEVEERMLADGSAMDSAPDANEQVEVEKEETLLSDNEIYDIVVDIYENLDKTMNEIRTEHGYERHWEGAAFIEDFDESHDELQFAYDITSKALEDYILIEKLDKTKDGLVHNMLIQYFNYLHWFLPLQEHYLEVGFEVLDQTADSFSVKAYEIADEFYSPDGEYAMTNIINFEKEDGKWKLVDFDWIPVADEPFNLTYEDFNCVASEEEITEDTPCLFIEMTEHEGETYLIYEDLRYKEEGSRQINALNVLNSGINYELQEKYSQNEMN